MKKTKYTKKQISEAIKYWESVLTKMNESRHRQPKTRSINDQVKHCEQVYNGPEGNCYIYNGHFVWTDNEGNEIEPPQKVSGNFDCSNTKITSLEGAPMKVHGSFSCEGTRITSLKGAPQKVSGFFSCSYTNITSLEGAPQKVGWTFDCSYCKNLTSLKGAPKKVRWAFNCSYCKNLTSLEGAPRKVGGEFSCVDTRVPFDEQNEYSDFLLHPTPEHIDATGHYTDLL